MKKWIYLSNRVCVYSVGNVIDVVTVTKVDVIQKQLEELKVGFSLSLVCRPKWRRFITR